eukprot:1335996-Amphidinium_carterae.1
MPDGSRTRELLQFREASCESHVLTTRALPPTLAGGAFDPDLAQKRKRPFPFGSAFDNVMIFPAADQVKFIE